MLCLTSRLSGHIAKLGEQQLAVLLKLDRYLFCNVRHHFVAENLILLSMKFNLRVLNSVRLNLVLLSNIIT